MPLFLDERETVQLETWEAEAEIKLDLPEGGEFLVLNGEFTETGERLRVHSWLRIPRGGRLEATAGQEGANVWVKTRHLRFSDAPVTA